MRFAVFCPPCILALLASCTMPRAQGDYQISQCGSDGKFDMDETSEGYLTCTGVTGDRVTWDVNRDDGTNVHMGSCTWSYQICFFDGPVYQVRRSESSISTLNVTRDHRNSIAGTVICGGNSNSVSARCKVRVVYKADRLSNCRASINTAIDRKDWTVNASCDVDKMYASDGNYTCNWIVPNGNKTETQEKGSLSTERFVANEAAYVRGTCSIHNLPMSTVTGTYHYEVIVNPGNTRLRGPRLKISYQILQCGSDGKVDLDETRWAYLTCFGIADDTVKWNIKRDDGTTFTMGSCVWSGKMCGYNYPPYVVKRTDYTTSTLIVKRDHRKSIAGTVICDGNQNSVSPRCKVRVVYKADSLSNCMASINNTALDRKDWTVKASCDVDKMFASDGNYTCYWIVPDGNGTETQEKGSLSTERFVVNTTAYVRGTCSIRNLPMPTVAGTYNYDVIVNPGNTRLKGPRLEIHKADSLSNCMASINNTALYRKDWTVKASCDVDKMFASDGNYTCNWIVTNGNGIETQEKGSLSTESFLTNTTAYVRGTCSTRNLPIPTVAGTYSYDVIVNPGNTRLTGPRFEIQCPTNKWRCSNNHCIWKDWRCDGEVHCGDGSDEQNCANWKCSWNWWKCGNNKCIWNADRCDGVSHCADGSDENNCEQWTCPSNRWKCKDNILCIWISRRCDGNYNCRDRSDEKNCVSCVHRAWKCSNDTQCVTSSQHCDGNTDCRDGSDEQNCV